MIQIINTNSSEPYRLFNNYHKDALQNNQSSIDAMVISSFDPLKEEVESRFVNLKYINNDEWVFFSNYGSTKASNFKLHNQVSVLFFWNSINLQIRIKASIKKSAASFSDEHYLKRDKKKNAISVSSFQSKAIESYDTVVDNFNKAYVSIDNKKRPNYWGGYSFTPYYFEFWTGHESRINKRDTYSIVNSDWQHLIIQP
jgi:pyridoxamine 5'-phosphate oxidase